MHAQIDANKILTTVRITASLIPSSYAPLTLQFRTLALRATDAGATHCERLSFSIVRSTLTVLQTDMTRTKQSARKSTGGRAPKKKVLKAPVASTAPANQARDDTSSSDGAINGDAPQSSRGYSETTIGDAAKTFTAAEWAGVLESVGLLYNQAMEIPGFIYGTWDDSKRQFVQMEPSDNVMNKLDPGVSEQNKPRERY